jgi:hypothetical protein
VVCTRGDAIAELVEEHRLGRVVDYADVDGLTQALSDVLDAPGGRAAYGECFREVAAGMTWERALAPLVGFCADPQPAPDRLAELPLVVSPVAPAESKGLSSALASARWRRPVRPPTPLWRLPLRALTYLRMGGPARLVQEVRSYVRWLQIRSAR